jgi:hypothetical protein
MNGDPMPHNEFDPIRLARQFLTAGITPPASTTIRPTTKYADIERRALCLRLASEAVGRDRQPEPYDVLIAARYLDTGEVFADDTDADDEATEDVTHDSGATPEPPTPVRTLADAIREGAAREAAAHPAVNWRNRSDG